METDEKKCQQFEFSSTDLIASTPIAITKKLPGNLTSFAFNSQQTTEKPPEIFISDNQRKHDYLSPIVKKIQLCASECTSNLPFQFSNPICYENASESNLSHQSENSFDLKRGETTEESYNTSDKLVCNTFATSHFSSYNITPKCYNKACLLCQAEKCVSSHENDDAPLSSIKNYPKKKSNISDCISHDYETGKSKDPECRSNLNSFGDLKEFHHAFDYSASHETSDTNCISPSVTNYLSSESFSSELSVYESFTTRCNQYIRDSGALHVKDESNLKEGSLSGAESKISSELENSGTDKNCLAFSNNVIISSPLLDNKEVSGADQSCNFSKSVTISDTGMNSKTESIESENTANLTITPVINKDNEIKAATDKSYNDTGLLKAASMELNEDDVHSTTLHSESYQALSNSEKTCSIKSGTSPNNEITWEKISFSEDYSSYINKAISCMENNDPGSVCAETDYGSNNQIDIASYKNTSPCNTVSFTMNTSTVNHQNTQEVLSIKEVIIENKCYSDRNLRNNLAPKNIKPIKIESFSENHTVSSEKSYSERLLNENIMENFRYPENINLLNDVSIKNETDSENFVDELVAMNPGGKLKREISDTEVKSYLGDRSKELCEICPFEESVSKIEILKIEPKQMFGTSVNTSNEENTKEEMEVINFINENSCFIVEPKDGCNSKGNLIEVEETAQIFNETNFEYQDNSGKADILKHESMELDETIDLVSPMNPGAKINHRSSCIEEKMDNSWRKNSGRFDKLTENIASSRSMELAENFGDKLRTMIPEVEVKLEISDIKLNLGDRLAADPLEASPFRESVKNADFNGNVQLSKLNDSLATSSSVCSINNEEDILDITEHSLAVDKSRDNHIDNPIIEISTLLDLLDFNNEVSKQILLALLGDFYQTGATQTLIVEHLKNGLFWGTVAELKEIVRRFFRTVLKGNIIERKNRRYFLKFVNEKQRETLLKMHEIKNETPRKKSSNRELKEVQVSPEKSFTMCHKRSDKQIENSTKTSSENSKVAPKSKHGMELRSPEKRKRRKLFHQ